MTLRVFRGEDFPVIDNGYFKAVRKCDEAIKKEVIDPYCIVSYAGCKGKTNVIFREEDPEWDTQFNFNVGVSG